MNCSVLYLHIGTTILSKSVFLKYCAVFNPQPYDISNGTLSLSRILQDVLADGMPSYALAMQLDHGHWPTGSGLEKTIERP